MQLDAITAVAVGCICTHTSEMNLCLIIASQWNLLAIYNDDKIKCSHCP